MTIKRARELLGEEAEKLTDDEVQNYINTAELLSEIAIDQFIKKQKKEAKLKNPSTDKPTP